MRMLLAASFLRSARAVKGKDGQVATHSFIAIARCRLRISVRQPEALALDYGHTTPIASDRAETGASASSSDHRRAPPPTRGAIQ